MAMVAPTQVGHAQKYRPEDEYSATKGTGNIMNDKRVVRGNTYAALVVPEEDPNELAKHREAQRRRLNRANKPHYRPGTPEAVPGRHHMDVQTDTYLEELTERTMEFEAETQTDFLLDRPSTPLFMPAKIGVDAATQIEDGELFNFEVEVEPILEVLVGKTLERSMMETLEEEELEAMRKHQEYFQQQREQELIEVQRMEAAEQRRWDEKSRRKEQSAARKQFDDAVKRKVLSRNLARSYLGGMQERCFEELQDAGVFHDPNLLAVESLFMPWVLKSVEANVSNIWRNQSVVNYLVKGAIEDTTKAHVAVLADLSEKLDEVENAERRIMAEKDEEARLEEMEAKRIEAEQARLLAGEGEEYVATFTVVSYAVDEETQVGVLTLDDETTDCALPAEMVGELQAKLAEEPADGEEKKPVLLSVNKSTKTVLGFA